MSEDSIGIIHYDIGNLLNVERAFHFIGTRAHFVYTDEEIKKCKKLVLPGVGAFSGCSDELKKRKLWDSIINAVANNVPILGICVGMQMLFEESSEFGSHEGFGFIKGRVKAIPECDLTGKPHKIPHIGWSGLEFEKSDLSNPVLLDGVKPEDEVYFVHSYMGVPEKNEDRVADIRYGGHKISAIVGSGNVFGTQFHPEKSGQVGLKILKNFSNL